MSSIEFHISKPMLAWIAQQDNTNLDRLADELAPKKRDKFLSGIINQKQADSLIKKVGIPFGFLFLNEPPQLEKPTLPDFRTVPDSEPLSNDFYQTLTDIQDKLAWYRDYLSEIGALPDKLPFVGKFSTSSSATQIAEDMAHTLQFDHQARASLSPKQYFGYISNLLENIGILVFKNGVVGNSNTKKLNVNEFRGFAIANPQVPAIFVNSADAKAAQLFTLLHEAAHIWLGKSGVSNPTPFDENHIEQLCNQTASEFLVPTASFLTHWQPETPFEDNLTEIAKKFRVSRYVIAIKALQQQKINRIEFEQFKATQPTKRNKSSGGDFYKVLPIRNSKTLTTAIARAALNRQILIRDGAKLLNIKPAALTAYARKVGI